MKTYNSFLVRCWRVKDSVQGDRIVFDIEHIQTGFRLQAADLSFVEAYNWALSTYHTLSARIASPACEMEVGEGEKAIADHHPLSEGSS